MTIPRAWRPFKRVEGPFEAREADIPELNVVFSDAFSDRYRKDGMVGVRVPPLNPSIWRFAIQDAAEGAMCWKNEKGEIVGFNIVHLSGTEGWMGPLCVRPDYQSEGLGKTMVKAGIQWLRSKGALVIGLETMPRTVENIGFYSTLGFVPGYMTITLTMESVGDTEPLVLTSRMTADQRRACTAACHSLTQRLMPGYDFTRELEITDRLSIGDTAILGDPINPSGFAVCHTAALVEGRSRDELRVLKLVLERQSDLPAMMRILTNFSKRNGTQRVSLRLQGGYNDSYRLMIALGARVRWTDLRMSVHGWTESMPQTGMVLSNWEI